MGSSSGWGQYRRRYEATRVAERVLTANAKRDNTEVNIDDVLAEAKKVDAWIYRGEINGEIEEGTL